jgi:hypothetical protein
MFSQIVFFRCRITSPARKLFFKAITVAFAIFAHFTNKPTEILSENKDIS